MTRFFATQYSLTKTKVQSTRTKLVVSQYAHTAAKNIFLWHIYSKNAILLRPVAARNDDNMVKTFQELYAYL